MPSKRDRSGDIAIIGFSGEFPKSHSIEEFWENIRQSRELISFFPNEGGSKNIQREKQSHHPNYVAAKGILEKSHLFDNELFQYSAREAEMMDPQARKFLMWAWESLENAGYDPDQYDGLIGVFGSCSVSSYLFFNLFSHLNLDSSAGTDEMLSVMGCDKDFLATRISYQLGLKGPSKTIQTACSSSLVAIHDACQSLLNYECDIALSGGVSITFPEKSGYIYVKEGINSKDGHCRPFDADSSGTVSGNGGGIVVLKRADEAINDGDTIRGFILGSAVNNDGRDKVGFTAPSVRGQAQAITQALSNAGLDPSEIDYIETHGTGTQLGDPIEIEALKQVFSNSQLPSKRCWIGSVKANIGHLDAASGVAGLIKTVLCLENRTVPPLKHFQKPNSKIDFESTPFLPATKLEHMVKDNAPIYAGVSSFGIGGTNAHVVLEAPPHPSQKAEKSFWLIFPFSAHDRKQLKELLNRYSNFLEKTDANLKDISFTLQVGRRQQEERAVFFARTIEELLSQINIYSKDDVLKSQSDVPTEILDIANRWKIGETIKWKECDLPKGRRIPLPLYPFKLKPFFIEPSNHPSRSFPPTEKKNRTFDGEIERIWCEVLKVGSAQNEDDFFVFGGDSLLALELCDSVRQTFHVDISLRDLLESPSLGDLKKHTSQMLLDNLEQLNEEQLAQIQEFL